MFTSFWFNLCIIVLLLGVAIGLIAWRVFKGNKVTVKVEAVDREHYSLPAAERFVQAQIKEMTSVNLYNLGLSPEQFERQKLRLQELEAALKNCNTGDLGSKTYVKDFIYDLLLTNYKFNEGNINNAIPFQSATQLEDRDIFDILLYVYAKKHGMKGLEMMIEEYKLANLTDDGDYRIVDSQIRKIFKEKISYLSFEEKLEIVVQRIYSKIRGSGVIDDIRDMSIDGVSGGVSGLAPRMENFDDEEQMLSHLKSGKSSLNSVWVMYKGKTIHFPFLSFGHEAELRRIVTLLYKYNSPGQLSESKPYIISEMYDSSRVTVMRPPFSESWAFFIRKKYDLKNLQVEQLLVHPNAEIPIKTVKYLMLGNRTTAITGSPGSGKTTLLMAMVGHINKTLNLRVQETAFEANLRSLYPLRNILTFQETASVTGQDGLDLSKKTDGNVSILTEVATDPVAAWMVQMAQVASLFTIFTHHAKTFSDLIFSIRNSLLKTGMFSNEGIAEQQVVSVIEFDVHLRQDYDGTRYVERITECIPIMNDDIEDSIEKLGSLSKDDKMDTLIGLMTNFFRKETQTRQFKERNIIEFVNGEYVAGSRISLKKQREIESHLSAAEREEFQEFVESVWGHEAS